MSLLKEAEQNVINRAKAYNDALEFVQTLSNFGNEACHEHIAKPKFFQGLQLIREAIQAEQSQAIRECFYFAGVGGEEALAYSRELFKKVFLGDYMIVKFLEKWGNVPSSYSVKTHDELKAECKSAMTTL